MTAQTHQSTTDLVHGRFAYQTQNATLTLREGLAEYYRVNPGLIDPDGASDQGAVFFRSHDACHVVFGTSTQITDEAATDFWTIFGVDLTVRQYATQFFESAEGKGLLKSFGWKMMLVEGWRSIFLVPRVWRQTRKMTRKWPWTGFDGYLDMPLGEIRSEFGIELLPAIA
jgi:hypothetical protein